MLLLLLFLLFPTLGVPLSRTQLPFSGFKEELPVRGSEWTHGLVALVTAVAVSCPNSNHAFVLLFINQIFKLQTRL